MRWFIAMGLFLALALAQQDQGANPANPAQQGQYLIGKIVSIGDKTATVAIKGRNLEAQLPAADPTQAQGGLNRDVPKYHAGQTVMVYESGGTAYIADPYRLNYLWGLLALFAVVVGLLGRGKGLRGLLGTLTSMTVLALFVVPEIAKGHNPLLVTFVGAFGILALSIYFVHGVNRKTSSALLGTTVAALVALVLAVIVARVMGFTGLSSEEAFLAQFALGNLDLVSLYLAGVVVGALGALNDVTVTQASVVQALVQANPRYNLRELYNRGMNVGFDHIGSLVNTLILAYAAGSLPLLLLVHLSDVPLLVLLNQEAFAGEVVSMLIGSLALVLAVPLTTLVAAWLLRGKKLDYLQRRWPEEEVAAPQRSVKALLGDEETGP